MKINVNVIYGILILVLICFAVVAYHNDNVLEARINSLNKNSIDFDSEKTFKEDYYITQQSNDTTLILTVFTLLATLTGFLTYINVVERYNAKVAEIMTSSEENERKYEVQHNRLIKLENEILFENANRYIDIYEKHLEKGELDKGFIISLKAFENFARCYYPKSEEVVQKLIPIVVQNHIRIQYDLLKNYEVGSILLHIDTKEFKIRNTAILAILDNEHIPIFNALISKVKLV